MAEGRFRRDLYFRLHVLEIVVPGLRKRPEDIPELVFHFLQEIARRHGRPVPEVTEGALSFLIKRAWPGNVRQLENTLFRAVVLCEGDELTVAEFPQIAVAQGAVPAEPIRTQPQTLAAPPQPQSRHSLSLTGAHGHVRPIEEIERDTLIHAIRHYDGQMTEVARRLGIGRSTLYRKLKELDLEEHSAGQDQSQAGSLWPVGHEFVRSRAGPAE